ncbi:hypothetical protein [Natronoarchaeum rubrum]|uniref:hypothetical protein n=1 Tax=Natronoarchaeum rubrum TaxID=755311 RepID=UPI002112EB12|nr:hypothetical protein [Natronoarchaeum rubrum]
MTDTERTEETEPSKPATGIADRVTEFVPDAVVERATNARRRVTTTVENSRLTAVAAKCRRYVVSSYLYRWLTKEPDPDVIVIDLRETRTVGPFIRLLDAVIEWLIPIWRESRAKALIEDINVAIRDAPLRVGGAALAAAILTHLLFTLVAQSFSIASAVVHVGLLGVAAISIRSSVTLEELLDTKTAQFLLSTFEPPDPPKRVDLPDEDQRGENNH